MENDEASVALILRGAKSCKELIQVLIMIKKKVIIILLYYHIPVCYKAEEYNPYTGK